MSPPDEVEEAQTLQANSKKFMTKLEGHPDRFDETELRSILDALTPWYVAFGNTNVPPPRIEVCEAYFRTFFNLTTERVVRAHLTSDMLPLVLKACERHMSPVLVAGVSNMAFEEETKKLMVEKLQGVSQYTRFLTSDDDHTRIHAARGVFSLTTVYDYKYRFGSVPILMAILVDGLTLMNDSLAMNCAGALANIAIHPRCKQIIAQAGALPKLREIAENCDSEMVLHQASRCMFSLAADRSNRKTMCDMGFLECLRRMMTYGVGNKEILANCVGCFGNLAMSESAAQNSTVAETVVPVFVASTDAGLDRQCARVLFSFCFKSNIKSLLSTAESMNALLYKIQRCETSSTVDLNVLRDMLGTAASVLYNNADMKRLAYDRALPFTLFTLWEKFSSTDDVMCNILRCMLSMSGTDEEKAKMFSKISKLKLLCELTDAEKRPPTLRKLALGALGVLSKSKCMRLPLLKAGALSSAVSALFCEPSIEARKHAYIVMQQITGNGLSSFSERAYMCGGNVVGEMHVLQNCLKKWIEPSRAGTDASFVSRSFACVEGTVTIRVYEPLIRTLCPTLLSKTEGLPLVSDKAWIFFNELLHSACVVGTHNEGPTKETALLAEAFGFRPTDDDVDGSKRARGEVERAERELPAAWRWPDLERELVDARRRAVDTMLTERVQTDIVFRVSKETTNDLEFAWPEDLAQRATNPLIAEMIQRWSAVETGTETSSDTNGVCSMEDVVMSGARQPSAYVYISAHRAILAERSEFFGMLFKSSWSESQEATFDFDFPLETLVVFLSYVYFGITKELERSLAENVELLWSATRMAHKYQMTGLLSACEFMLAKTCLQISPETAIAMIAHAETMHLPCLWAMVFSAYHMSVGPRRGRFNRALEAHPKTKAVFDENIEIQSANESAEAATNESTRE